MPRSYYVLCLARPAGVEPATYGFEVRRCSCCVFGSKTHDSDSRTFCFPRQSVYHVEAILGQTWRAVKSAFRVIMLVTEGGMVASISLLL